MDEVSHLSLVTDDEARELKLRIDTFLAHNPDAGRAGQVGPLYRGIAAHHAGILPLWKGLVEELFQAGLIKVVFATETLAAGINMPARTTVIASLSKRTDSGHRLLTSTSSGHCVLGGGGARGGAGWMSRAMWSPSKAPLRGRGKPCTWPPRGPIHW